MSGDDFQEALTPSRSNRLNGADGRALRDVGAVILAGGRGTRLAPYTSVLPKPLMPVGGRSILELVVDQLSAKGVTQFTFCVGYLSYLIEAVFDHRAPRGTTITYVRERHPMGTAAPLKLIDTPDSTFLVMNGDVLTTLDYAELVHHHQASGNVVTIATRQRRIKIDYGILYLDDAGHIHAYEEKPEIASHVSMGIYVVEPGVLEHIPDDRPFDFPDLVHRLLEQGEQVGSFEHEGLWFDIGNHEDYLRAVELWEQAHPREPAAEMPEEGRVEA